MNFVSALASGVCFYFLADSIERYWGKRDWVTGGERRCGLDPGSVRVKI